MGGPQMIRKTPPFLDRRQRDSLIPRAAGVVCGGAAISILQGTARTTLAFPQQRAEKETRYGASDPRAGGGHHPRHGR
jgi:hypothetical protein